MPNGNGSNLLVNLAIAGGIGYGVYWWLSRDQVGPDGENGNGNGGPAGLELDSIGTFFAVSAGQNGTEIAAPGEDLIIDLSASVGCGFQSLIVTNHSDSIKYLSGVLELRKVVSGFPDLTWLRFEPNRGLVTDHLATRGVIASGPPLQGRPINPGETFHLGAMGLTMQGSGTTQEASLFWAEEDGTVLAYKMEVKELASATATSGRTLDTVDLNPAFTCDVRGVITRRQSRAGIRGHRLYG